MIQSPLAPILNQSLAVAWYQLGQFASNDALFANGIATAFGAGADASQFQGAWAKGDFSSFPAIEVRSSAEINGANGAFSITTGKIYLAQEFVEANVNNLEVIAAVLLEEYGHYVDSQINVSDSAGDEGDIFARLVQGKNISESELAVLKAEDDTETVTLDGQVVQIERNVTGAYQSGQWWLDNARDGNGNMQGSSANENIGGLRGNDTIKGGGGNDLLSGDYDNDSLYGEGGDDTLVGSNGADFFVDYEGSNLIDGGLDTDTVSYKDSPYGVTVGEEALVRQQRGYNNYDEGYYNQFGFFKKYSFYDAKVSRFDANGEITYLAITSLREVDTVVGSNFDDKLYTRHIRNIINGL